MEAYLKEWLEKNRYKFYAEAKGYYVYENEKFTLVIHETSGLRLMKHRKNEMAIVLMTKTNSP